MNIVIMEYKNLEEFQEIDFLKRVFMGFLPIKILWTYCSSFDISTKYSIKLIFTDLEGLSYL